MTVQAIIEAAERLFAKHGIDGVSMRQISQEAGSGNHFSVQYHFGDKKALAEAIIANRMPDLERRRGELLAEVTRAGALTDVHALMRALLLPYCYQTDVNGEHSYAAFAIHLYWHSSIPPTWQTSPEFAPMVRHIITLISQQLDLPDDISELRLRLALVSFLHVVVDRDQWRTGVHGRAVEDMWEDAVRFAVGGLTAPWLAA